MTRTLILTRHAKSSWNTPGMSDHDRPLNKRGRASAEVIGSWLQHKKYEPDEVMSSTSVRTRETWRRMKLSTQKVGFFPNLYHADPHQIRQALSEATGQTVLLLGHNPGISVFAERVVQTAPDHPRFFDYPTCATTVIRFDLSDWSQISWHTGLVVAFVIPRELAK
ncbi:MAG: SixA phosphatase family protein [Ruegeria sp.]